MPGGELLLHEEIDRVVAHAGRASQTSLTTNGFLLDRNIIERLTDGNAQYCASQRGRLNKPIVEYTRADMKAQHRTYKACENGCAIFCVFRASQLDNAPVSVARVLLRSIGEGTISLPRPGRSLPRSGAVPAARPTSPGPSSPGTAPAGP